LELVDLHREEGSSTAASAVKFRNTGEQQPEQPEGPREHLLTVTVNDVPTMRLVCSPSDLTALVLGRLYTEGLISSVDEVELIYLCKEGARANVQLKKEATQRETCYLDTTPSCCTGNRILNDLFSTGRQPEPLTPIPWKEEWIFRLAEVFSEDTPVHRATGGTHSCYLVKEGQLLYCCEDLGRHNAMDKVIGMALRDGVDLHQTALYTSGRVPTDMAEKAIRAGVPVLMSKASPTDMAITLAKNYGLTLICNVRPQRFTVYAGGL
jgi:FdhD protein